MSNEINDIEYLKPINYDDLFDDRTKNSCTDYQVVLDKLTQARLAYFSSLAGIYNFIKDCSKLQKKIRSDISDNDLSSIKYEYSVLINNLIATIAISLRKRIPGDDNILINFEVPPTQPNKDMSDMRDLESTNIVYADHASGIDTLVTTLPSVCLYLTSSYQLQIRFIYPKSVSYGNLTHEKIYIKSFRSKENEVFTKNLTAELESINFKNNIYGFVNAENAHDVLSDIVNFDDENIFTHNLNDVIERINSIILGIENTHRSIVQQMKAEKISK